MTTRFHRRVGNTEPPLARDGYDLFEDQPYTTREGWRLYGAAMSTPLDVHDQVPDREAFVAFLYRLQEDYIQRGEDWENPRLDLFLGSLAQWIRDTPGWYAKHFQEELPPEGNWTYFAQALMAATIYE